MKENLVFKIIFTMLIIIAILAINNTVLATNENYTILQKTEEEYIIYVKKSLDKEFEFVFTNEVLENDTKLDYIKSAKDSKDGLPVAYVDKNLYDKYFEGKTDTYLWAKNTDGYIAKGIKIDLKESITETMVEYVKNATRKIAVDTDEKDFVEVEKDGIKYTTTTGKIIIKDSKTAKYYYIMTNITTSKEYARFMELAEKINKDDSANIVIKLDNSKEFYDLYSELMLRINNDSWVEVENMEIPQPKESKTGDKYVIWVKQENSDSIIEDVQFMTCYQEEDRKYVKEEQVVATTSKLPITYDNNVLFVVLIVAIVLFVVLLILRKRSNNKISNNYEK